MNWLKGDGPLELWLTLLDARLLILDVVLGTAAITSMLWAPYLINKARLAGGSPIHASPLENQALPLINSSQRSRNFVGWLQFRELYEESRA